MVVSNGGRISDIEHRFFCLFQHRLLRKMSQRDIRSLFGKKAGGGDDEKTESARVLIISFLNPSHIFYFILLYKS